METVHEFTIAATFVVREDEEYPNDTLFLRPVFDDEKDVEEQIKKRLGADDIHVTDHKVFLTGLDKAATESSETAEDE